VPDLDFSDVEAELLRADEEEAPELAGVLELEEVEPEVEEALTPIDDLSQTIFVEEKEPVKPERKKKAGVVVVRPTTDEPVVEEDSKRKKRKGQALVYNEELDQVVVKRTRKKGSPEWLDEDIDLTDIDIDI